MSSVARSSVTIASARRSRSFMTVRSPPRSAVAPWIRKRFAPSYSITTRRSGGAVRIALSRWACWAWARGVQGPLSPKGRGDVSYWVFGRLARGFRRLLLGERVQLTREPLALRLARLERRLHRRELRLQRLLLLVQDHLHRGDPVVQILLLRVLGGEPGGHRAAGLQRRGEQVVERHAEAARAA